MKKLIREIHRRSMWQVLGIYLGGSWAALQAVDVLAGNFGLPHWFPGLALGLLVLGLPITLATAFVQEGRPDTDGDGSAARASIAPPDPRAPREVSAPAPQRLLTWRNALIGGAGAALLWTGVAVGWLLFGGARAPEASPAAAADVAASLRSIAVLPFSTFTASEDDRYFAEGIHDDLLTQLAKLDSLKVISRTSVAQYENTQKTIPEIAKELGVATILEGGVQRSGERMRMNVQLIEAATDRHLWAETYDEELTAANVFAIQSDLARKIAEALSARLTPEVASRISARPTESLQAYDLYIRGRVAFLDHAGLGEQIPETRALFEQAIAADSNFAAAWTGLADTYLAAANWQQVGREAAYREADRAIARALALNPDLPEAHSSKSRLLLLQGRPEDAEMEARRAVELNPGSAEAHGGLGRALERLGRFGEAVDETRRAVELDPTSLGLRDLLGDRYYFSKQYDAAIKASRQVLEMAPDHWYAWYNIGWAQAMAGRAPDAVDAFRRAASMTSDNARTVSLGMAYAFARAGQKDSARARLASAGGDPDYDGATVYFTIGDFDAAFSSLEAALRRDPSTLTRMSFDPATEPLRADPRFAALVRKLGMK